MPSRSFLTVADGSTVTFDADLAKSFQVTLAGNRSLVIAGGREGDEIAILLIQDSSGSRVPTWGSNVTWEAGQAPNLATSAGGMNLVTLVKRGSSWQDKAGAPSKLPSRITDRSLSTIALVGATASIVLNLSGGGGQGVGNLPDALRVASNSGAQINTVVNGTGSVAIGSGYLVVGSLKDDSAAKFRVANNGATTIRGSASGYSLTVSDLGAAPLGSIPCVKAGGLQGWHKQTATGFVYTVCN